MKTEKDPEGRMWTTDGPDAVVARRVQDIAKATWNSMQANDGSDYDVKVSYSDFNPLLRPCYQSEPRV